MDKSTLFMKDHLVAHIETLLGWGAGNTWGNKDFEELSERIFKKTGKRLSVTTLKRIWGRAEWVANPSMATLDILSEFSGYEDWREFVRKNKTVRRERPVSKNRKMMKVGVVVLALGIAGLLLSFFFKTSSADTTVRKTYSSEDFKFKSRPVSDEIPNSVVFEYDASAVHDSSVVEIQQSWDDSKRIVVDKNDSIATCIYYRPGFFKAKLVVDDTIVKRNDVFITTQEWMGIIQRETLPIYLEESTIFNENRLEISPELIASQNLDPKTSRVTASLYQVKDFGELYIDDFEMTMALKNNFEEGMSACQETQVVLLYDGSIIGIPLAKLGCSSNLNVMAFGKFIDGKKNDLSGFGVNFKDFVRLKCLSKDGKLTIFIDDEQVYSMDVPEEKLKIKGIAVHFEGAGSIKDVVLKNSKHFFYESKF